MKLIQYLLMPFYRVWFYTLVMVGITLFSPLLFLGTVRERWYKIYFTGARWWGMFVLFGMGFMPKVERRTEYVPGASYMFVANHVSMIDIMLMLYVANRPFVFVGKKELAKIPIFGFFYRRGCILVDRNDPASRRSVYAQAQKRLSEGLGICIFPEGGVPNPKIDLAPFKDGAFRLAVEHQIPIAPMTFVDNKRRFPYSFFVGSPGTLRVVCHPVIETKGLGLDGRRDLKDQTRALIESALLA
jgi:1-acyl-sn-glycerol-3-phosphate acyltransferase